MLDIATIILSTFASVDLEDEEDLEWEVLPLNDFSLEYLYTCLACMCAVSHIYACE